MRTHVATCLLLLCCCTTISAQVGSGGGGGSGGGIGPWTGANDVVISPAGMSMDPGYVGQIYWVYPAFTATGINQQNPDNYITWSVVEGVLPPGLSLIPDGDQSLGVKLGQAVCAIAGKPKRAGTYVFSVKAMDNFSRSSDVQRYSIVIRNAGDFVITQGSVPDAETGTAYNTVIGCTAIGGPFTWSWQAAPGSQLPPGLALDTNSTVLVTTLSGTPTLAGAYDFHVSVSNGAQTLTNEYHLEVDDIALAIESPNPIPIAQQGQYYGYQFRGVGGNKPYRWLCDNLPTGFSLDRETGYIWNPAPTPGSYSFDVTLWDDSSNQNGIDCWTTVQFNLDVYPPGGPGGQLSITTAANLPTGVEQSGYQQTLTATGGTSPYVWSASGLPSGFTLSSAGVLTAPAASVAKGVYQFDVTVTDAGNATDSRQLTLTIDGAVNNRGKSGGGGGCVAAGGGALLPALLPFLFALRRRRR